MTLPSNVLWLPQQEWWLFHTWDPAHNDLANKENGYIWSNRDKNRMTFKIKVQNQHTRELISTKRHHTNTTSGLQYLSPGMQVNKGT